MLDLILATLLRGILIGSVYSLVSIGLTLVFGVMDIINFAHCEFLMIGMYISYWAWKLLGLDPLLPIFFVVPILFLLGLAIHKFIINPVLKAPVINQFLLTAGLMILLQNLALFLWKADFRRVEAPYLQQPVYIGGLPVAFSRVIAFAFALALSIAFYFFLMRTGFGKAMRATAQNRAAAMLLGINIYKVHMFTFAVSSVLAGIGGTLIYTFYPMFPTVGVHFLIVAWAVVVVGGLGNFIGALIGGFMIGIAEAFTAVFISAAWSEMVVFIVLIVILLLRPTGLLGKFVRRV